MSTNRVHFNIFGWGEKVASKVMLVDALHVGIEIEGSMTASC